jgi:hypothetical protein
VTARNVAQTSVCGDCLLHRLKSVPPAINMTSELENKTWSVISERGCEASSVTHEEARRLVHRLGAEGRHGLCIISDEAARRLNENASVNPQATSKTPV